MPKRKSAEDIRKQTNRICRLALERMRSGSLTHEAFGKRIAHVSVIESRYTENIQHMPLYILKLRQRKEDADRITFDRAEYMNHEGVSRT